MTDPAAPFSQADFSRRSSLALFGIVLGYAAFNAATSWTTIDSETLIVLAFALLVFQTVIFGVWTALGEGSFFTRLPIAIPCLLILFVVPGCVPEQFADIDRRDFFTTVAVGYAIFAAAILLFLIFRWTTGFRILPLHSNPGRNNSGLRFSMKHLLVLITTYSVALGMATHLKFYVGILASGFFAPNFFIYILIQGGILFLVNVLPTLAVPLLILHSNPSKRAMLASLAFWMVATATVVATILRFGDMELTDLLELVLVGQLGVAIAGALTAIPLRLAGLRLVRYDSHNSPPEVSSLVP